MCSCVSHLPSGVGSGDSRVVVAGVVDLAVFMIEVVDAGVVNPPSVVSGGVVELLSLSGEKVGLKRSATPTSPPGRFVLGLNLSAGLLVGRGALVGVLTGVVKSVVVGVVNTTGGSLPPGDPPGRLISTTSRRRVTPSLLTADTVTALGAKVDTSTGCPLLTSLTGPGLSALAVVSFMWNFVRGILAKLATP